MFKVFIAIVLFLALSIVLFLRYIHEDKPKGFRPDQADLLAQKMLEALNHKSYDSIKVLQWEYVRGHAYVWNKSENIVEVKWDDVEVVLNTQDLSGKVIKNGEPLWDEEKEDYLKKAWKFFTNDSFWLVAPFKVNDPGTSRSIVEIEDSDKHGLMVTYSSGGVTPGDSYLWILDENYRPIAWKMWVDIIPVGGLKVEWTEWKSYKGALFATNHIGSFGIELPIRNLKVE